MKKQLAGVLATLLLITLASPAEAVKIKKFKNCTAMNKVYPHGVAKKGYSKTASGLTGDPFVNTKLYNKNSGSDRDKDGVACEK
jgi:hypothetical protein